MAGWAKIQYVHEYFFLNQNCNMALTLVVFPPSSSPIIMSFRLFSVHNALRPHHGEERAVALLQQRIRAEALHVSPTDVSRASVAAANGLRVWDVEVYKVCFSLSTISQVSLSYFFVYVIVVSTVLVDVKLRTSQLFIYFALLQFNYLYLFIYSIW